MKKYLFLLIFISAFTQAFSAFSQKVKNRIEPGRMYSSGDSLVAPRYGFTSTVPQGWTGTLPRETEIFLLNLATGTFGEIFVFGRSTVDLNQLSEEWKAGVDVTETLRLQATNPQINDNMMSSEAKAVGNFIPAKKRAFAAVRCGDTGTCVTVLAISQEDNYDEVSKAAEEFLANATFDAPREIDPYLDFDWKEFLTNKLLIVYDEFQGGEQKTRVNLCADGSFEANIKKKGIMKDFNPEYKGKMVGSWSVESKNSEAVLTLTFSKKDLSPVVAQLKFVNEELYVNDERYYASQSEKCK
jgi:hypothetical protein